MGVRCLRFDPSSSSISESNGERTHYQRRHQLLGSTKMSYIPSKACQAQGRKRPRFSKDENVPHSEQQVPKCPTFRVRLVKHKDENVPDSARTKTSHIPREVQKRPRFSKDENVPHSEGGTKTAQILQLARYENVPNSI